MWGLPMGLMRTESRHVGRALTPDEILTQYGDVAPAEMKQGQVGSSSPLSALDMLCTVGELCSSACRTTETALLGC